jgi:uncharacterized protein (DUF849 family)
MNKKLIINFTPTGAVPTKKMTPHVPISPEEICNDTIEAYKLGAQMVHIHARDIHGNNTLDKHIYADIIKKIRNSCPDIIICASLTGRFNNTFEARSGPLELEDDAKPDMGSLTLSSLNFSKVASTNSPEMVTNLLKKMNEKGIKPELEAFDQGMINYSKYLIKKGLLQPPYYYNILYGNLCTAQDSLMDLGYLVNSLPENSIYSFAGIGKSQKSVTGIGIISANGVRIGLEDNIYTDQNMNVLATNIGLVKNIVDLAKTYGREIATCKEVREMLGLN